MVRCTGRIFALIDEACFSATDNFLAALADLHPSVRFIGRPTNGPTGAPRQVTTLAHSGAKLTLCVMRVSSPKGRLIEGAGTIPDVPVRWTRGDIAAARDPDLETALAPIRGSLRRL